MKPLTVGSLFSGIGGFDLGFERAGLQCAWQVEIANHPTQVLETHWPYIRRHRDVKAVGKNSKWGFGSLAPVDIICGGFPCQDVSVAGKRKGLDGERSGLWFEFYRIITELRPEWVVIENVPGLLSSNKGRDFAVIIRALAEFGYGIAWRILDAQFFGVAQRRRRVFIVGHLGTGRASEILFEAEGSAEFIDAGKEARAYGPAPTGADFGKREVNGNVIAVQHAMVGRKPEAGPQGKGWRDDDKSWTLDNRGQADIIVFDTTQITISQNRSNPKPGQPSHPLASSAHPPAIAFDSQARRLTPTECERLQGFPDGWTAELSDSARYRTLGNAVAVPVAEWIGKRIVEAS